jgi:hypothetical protein
VRLKGVILMTQPLADWGGHLQSELEKADQALAHAERTRQRPGYGPELGPDSDAQANIDRLRGARDVRQKALDDWRANPSNT